MRISMVMLVFSICLFGTALAEPLLIGVAEESRKAVHGKGVARVLFVREKSDWEIPVDEKSIEKYDVSNRIWTLAFDGRNLGTIRILDDLANYNSNYPQTFRRDKIFRIQNQEKYPQIKDGEGRFYRWAHNPKIRPIVIVSKPNCKDFEKWKRFKPDRSLLGTLLPHMKKTVPTPLHCTGLGVIEYEMREEDLKFDISYISYKNNKDEFIVSVKIHEKHTGKCNKFINKYETPIWFFISKSIRFIGYQMTLVDAGDYDSDNEIEFIFWHSGYNEDGYTLFDNNFKTRLDYFWIYH